MADEIFVDGVGEIGFGNGAIRIDFYSLASGVDQAGKPNRQMRQRMVMTPNGFLETYSVMQGMIDKLVENGVMQRKPAAAPVANLAAAKPVTKV